MFFSGNIENGVKGRSPLYNREESRGGNGLWATRQDFTRERYSGSTPSWGTWSLIAINVFVYLVFEAFKDTRQLQHLFYQFGAVPLEFSLSLDLPPYVPFPVYGTVLTMLFLHTGWSHLLSNMICLWFFGQSVERVFGPLRFGLFFLCCGVLAGLFHVWCNPLSTIPSIGASGAIAGILAAHLLMFPMQKITLTSGQWTLTVSTLQLVGIWVGFQILSTLTVVFTQTSGGIGVAYFAHLGGFLAGLPLTYLFWGSGQQQAEAQ